MNLATSGGITLRVQSVLYGNEPDRIIQTIENLERAVDLAIFGGYLKSASLVYGDCSPIPVFKPGELSALTSQCRALSTIAHDVFDGNLGSALGHNTLFKSNDADYVLIMNPDVIMSPNAIIEMIKAMRMPDTGMVEAKQLPIEHPKEFNPVTGELFHATRGEGAFLGDRRLKIGPPPQLAQTLLATGFAYAKAVRREQARIIASLLPEVRDIRRAGTASLDLAYVAAGRLDVYFERTLMPWDHAAGELLVTEAGGVIEGLYAVGNCSAALLPTYPGPGATLGPAMTMAYQAAKHINQYSD